MLPWLKRIFGTLSLLLALATVTIWTYVAFYANQRISWQGDREYSLDLEMYAYRFDVLRCSEQTVEVRGHRGLVRSQTPVPMRGVDHYASTRRGHGFYFEFVQSWPAENPTRPLPPPLPLAGGGTLITELRVDGIDFGLPYWFVTTLALLPPTWMATQSAAAHLRKRKQSRMTKLELC